MIGLRETKFGDAFLIDGVSVFGKRASGHKQDNENSTCLHTDSLMPIRELENIWMGIAAQRSWGFSGNNGDAQDAHEIYWNEDIDIF